MKIGFIKSGPGLLALPAALTAFGDFLLYRQALGINVVIMLTALTAAVLARYSTNRISNSAYASLLALVLLSAAILIEPSVLAAVLSLATLAALAASLRFKVSLSLAALTARLLPFLSESSARIIKDIKISRRILRRTRCSFGGCAKGFARRWGLPVLGALLFAWLFSKANPVFQEYAEDTLNQLSALLLPEAQRVFFWIGLSLLSWLLVRAALRRPAGMPEQGEAVRILVNNARRADVAIRSLAVFNLLFALETSLDLIYLWGGKALPHGMTYAEYAHRGAYPLLATAMLAALFVLIIGPQLGQSRALKGLVLAWIAQNMLLLVSTIWRLYLYIDAYSMTLLRMYTMIWVALVMFGFLSIALKIYLHKINGWLIGVNLKASLAVLLLSCVVNYNGFAAWYNVTHCVEVTGHGPTLDLPYMKQLGLEALPALEWYIQRTSERGASAAASQAFSIRGKLKADLEAKLANWRGFSLRRYTLRDRV